jgi:nicotinamidase-related amidase
MSGLVPQDGEAVLSKTSINAFTTTNLQQLLGGDGITEVTICGLGLRR